MIKTPAEADRVLVAKFGEAGQGQVFDFWGRLGPPERRALLGQLHALDLPLLRKLTARYLRGSQEVLESRVLTPPPRIEVGGGEGGAREAREAGEAALRAGRVAVLTAAGEPREEGGFDRPRGVLPIGPVSGKSLFRHHAERIRALARRYRTAIPWIIATSPGDHADTMAHFQGSNHFGLSRTEVTFLTQDELPVVNRRGKILLAAADRVATSPNGHGGVLLKLLAHQDLLHSLEARGVEHVFYFQVDNPMVKIADSEFLGHHIRKGCDMSSKSVRRIEPDEPVGIFCQFNGTLGVVEHRELGASDRARRTPDGGLEFWAGNIGVHIFTLEFLRRLRTEKVELPYHSVERATPHLDRRGNRVTPGKPGCIHFECSIFDALPLARAPLVVETERSEEFSPVKRPAGGESPETARRDLSRLYARWLEAAGAELETPRGADPGPIEISPLYALDAEELKEKLEAPTRVGAGFFLQ
ncbi:MAG: UTP--glucose-1-phosphate uridylyltransferase [Thermoanaerobaculia bacterium]